MAARIWVDERVKKLPVTVDTIEKKTFEGIPLSSDASVNKEKFANEVNNLSGGLMDVAAVLKLPKGKLRDFYLQLAADIGVELEYPGRPDDSESAVYTLKEWTDKNMGTPDEWITYFKAAYRVKD